MLNRLPVLLVLLLAQLVLIIWLYSGNNRQDNEPVAETAWLPVQADKLTEIVIKDDKNASVVLQKKGDSWLLPGYHQLKVDPGLLEQLIEKINAARPEWPIARTEGAAERFAVAPATFKRQLVFKSADESSRELFLGDSPGLRKLYAKWANSTDIYAIDFGLYLAPVDARRWFDKRLLKVRQNPNQIKADDFVLTKQGDAWQLQEQQENEALDQAALDALVSAIVYPQVSAVASDEQTQALKGKKANKHYTVKAGGEEISYDYYRVKDDVILKSSLSDFYFVIPVFVHETLLGSERKKLIKALSQDG